jgi:hypothetical protein
MTGQSRARTGIRTRFAIGVSAQIFACLFVLCPPADSQVLLQNADTMDEVNLLPSDAAILDMEEVRTDLPCSVTPIKPLMGFDMKFHSGYDISIPLKELASNGQILTVVFSVTPDANKDHPRFFSQKFKVPEIDEDAGGKTVLEGGFDVGEGSYHVRWLMRDHMERLCSSTWDITASLSGRDQDMAMTIRPNEVQAAEAEFFQPEPPVARRPGNDPLKVKVLINYAPQESSAAAMAPIDTSALVSILRTIDREPRIMKFSIVAFNLNEQRVVYRADDLDEIDFPELGRQLASLKLGMVDYRQLANPRSPTEFLTRLVQDELAGATADAVVFAGPKAFLDHGVEDEDLKEVSNISYPVFYMNYMLVPRGVSWSEAPAWRDAIGNVVKRLHGFEYTISRPRDLWSAWVDIMDRISKVKLIDTASASPH